MSNSTESNSRKEEILQKSRLSRVDEGVEYAELRGHKLAANVAFIIAGIPVLIYSILFGQILVVLAITIFIEAYYACLAAVVYRLSKKIKYIFYSAMCVVFFIFCAFMFVRVAIGLPVLPRFGI